MSQDIFCRVLALVRSNSTDDSKSSENISFRLNKDQLHELRAEAKQKRISLNTLVSQVVDSYVNYNTNLSKAGVIPLSKTLLIALVETCTEDELKLIAEQVQEKAANDLSLQLRGKYDFEALLSIFDYWLISTGFRYRHDIKPQNNGHKFMIQHDMGRKYSFFTAECIRAYFEPMAIEQVEYTISDNVIVLTVEGKA